MSDHAVSSNDSESVKESRELTLAGQLDSAIEETSSGIGMMIADVVRRSLIGGVSDIERTISGVASERVEAAVDAQMPAFAEAAHRVAESTSNRVVKSAIQESETRTRDEVQTTIKTAVTAVEETVQQKSESLQQANNETRQRVDDTIENIAQLQERSQQSWKRVKSQFESIGSELTDAKAQLTSLRDDVCNGLSTAERTDAELREVVSQLMHKHERTSEATVSQLRQLIATCQRLQEQNDQLRERIVELEKPKGLKAVWQKFKPGRKSSTDETAEDADSVEGE